MNENTRESKFQYSRLSLYKTRKKYYQTNNWNVGDSVSCHINLIRRFRTKSYEFGSWNTYDQQIKRTI
jgi:hypothetical protein